MRVLIKLSLALLMLHAVWRVGSSYWGYYTFEDEIVRTARFGGRMSEEELREEVLEIAGKLQIPLKPEAVSVHREPRRIYIDAVYTEQIPIVPGYTYPWEFKINAEAWTSRLP